MISLASEKNISTAKKRDIAPFKVNGQSHIILQQLSCGTRSKVSFVSKPAQISLKHSSQLTNKTTLTTSFVFIRHVFHCVLHVQYTPSVSEIKHSGPTYSTQNVRQISDKFESRHSLSPTIWSDILVLVGRESGYVKHFVIDAYL